jgi:hypothetical protein
MHQIYCNKFTDHAIQYLFTNNCINSKKNLLFKKTAFRIYNKTYNEENSQYNGNNYVSLTDSSGIYDRINRYNCGRLGNKEIQFYPVLFYSTLDVINSLCVDRKTQIKLNSSIGRKYWVVLFPTVFYVFLNNEVRSNTSIELNCKYITLEQPIFRWRLLSSGL